MKHRGTYFTALASLTGLKHFYASPIYFTFKFLEILGSYCGKVLSTPSAFPLWGGEVFHNTGNLAILEPGGKRFSSNDLP